MVHIRKWGTHPHITKLHIQKTRALSEYVGQGEQVPMQSDKLKIRLIKEGYLEEKCYNCGRTEWEEEVIPLQLNHINGNSDDNSLSNLELLCPNCHAQTADYRLKNEFSDMESNENKENPNTDI